MPGSTKESNPQFHIPGSRANRHYCEEIQETLPLKDFKPNLSNLLTSGGPDTEEVKLSGCTTKCRRRTNRPGMGATKIEFHLR